MRRESAESRQWRLCNHLVRLLADFQHKFSILSAHNCWKLANKDLVCLCYVIYARDQRQEYLSKVTRRTLRRWSRTRIYLSNVAGEYYTGGHCWKAVDIQHPAEYFAISRGRLLFLVSNSHFSSVAYHFSAKMFKWIVSSHRESGNLPRGQIFQIQEEIRKQRFWLYIRI